MDSNTVKPIDLIWNISLICPWDCAFCCTDAVHVGPKKDGLIRLSEQSLSKVRMIPISQVLPPHLEPFAPIINRFDLALIDRQSRGLELTYEQKLTVLQNLTSSSVKIDFAGGDPLACYENYLVIKRAAELFGQSAISITTTGASWARYDISEVAQLIGQFEFTFDEPVNEKRNRPKSYNRANLKVAQQFVKLGTRTKAQAPLHSGNIWPKQIEDIYMTLNQASIDELLLMRVFPVGRAQGQDYSWNLTNSQLIETIDLYRRLSEKYDKPRLRLQCALRNLYPGELTANPCDAIKSSFGINWMGELLISAWANSNKGNVLDDVFVLGNLTQQSLADFKSSELVKQYSKRLDENYGHCKVFAFIHSKQTGLEALYDQADPLFENFR